MAGPLPPPRAPPPAAAPAWSPGPPEPAGLPEGFWQNEGLRLLGTPPGEGPSRGEDAPLPLGPAAVGRHLQKTLEAYRRFLAGLGEVARDAALPPGALNVLTGGPPAPADAAQHFVEHPGLDKLSFTVAPR